MRKFYNKRRPILTAFLILSMSTLTTAQYTNDYCVEPSGATGILNLGTMSTSDINGAGTYTYLNRVVPGYGTVDITVVATGGKHKNSTSAIQGAYQTSWSNESLPTTNQSALFVEPNSGGNITTTYAFDQPTGNIDLLFLDLDLSDVVTFTAKDGDGLTITDFTGWRYRSGDMSVWENPDPVASPPSWNAATQTLTSTDAGNDHRSFGLLTPDVLVTEFVISFSPTGSGRHIYHTIYSMDLGRDDEVCVTLPLDLVEFSVVEENCVNRLNWKTENEVNFNSFELEQSFDGTSFEAIQTIPSKGGSAKATIYTYEVPTSTKQSFFRLKMIDEDGSFSNSEIVTVKSKCFGSELVSITNVYPSPASNEVNITTFNLGNSSEVQFRLTNGFGQEVAKWFKVLSPGENRVQLPTNDIPDGNYYMQIGTEEWSSTPLQLVIMK